MKLEQLINKWTVLVLGIWLICAIVACVAKNAEVMDCALFMSIFIGLGWLEAT